MWEKIKSWFGFADLNKDGKVTSEDLVVAKAVVEKNIKEANEKINEVVTDVKTRANRVKEEVTDVVIAAKETVNQVGDIVAAAKGKARKGRKKK